MLKYVLLFALGLAAGRAQAQHKRYVQFEETDSVYQSYFSHLRVIDARADKENIGTVRTGFGKQWDVVTEQPLDKTLEAYFDKILAHQGTHELVMVVYDMRVEMRNIPSFYMDCDYFSNLGNGQYAYLGKVSRLFETAHTIDVADREIGTMQEHIRDRTLHFAVPEPKTATTAILKEEQLLQRRQQEKLAYAIYDTTKHRPGIYATPDAFMNARPIDTPFTHSYMAMGNNPQLYFYYTKPNGKKGDRIYEDDYFAIYDGKQWYVSDNKKPHKMSFEKGEFHVTRSYQGKNNSNAGGVVFGAAGALAVAALSSSSKEAESVGEYDAIFDPAIKNFRLLRHK